MDAKFSSMPFQSLWIFYITVLLGHVGNTQSNNCPKIFQKTDRSTKEIKVEKSFLQKCDLFYDLIVILEQLNILIPRNTSCYALQKIVQTYDQTNPQSNSQTVRISFQFQENFKTSFDSSMCTSSTVLYNTSSQKQVDSERENENVNNTLAVPKADVNNDSSVLSHTQVVVIATCSAVIGTFFILAAALRIRNYVKRVREEQQASRRSNNYRLPLTKGANATEGHSRKSSSSSRNSQQNSLLGRDGNDYHRNSNSPSACRQPLLDAMPRLIVTAPSTAPSTPGDSHSSIQFIDEEVEESAKANDESAADNEQTLRKEEKENVDTIEKSKEQIHDDNPTPCEHEQENSTAIENIDANDITVNGNDMVNTHSNCESQQEDEVCDTIPQQTLQQMLSVTIGLTQSDNSLSNNNSYCYGNQVEYSGNAEYENMGYSPVLDNEVNSIREVTDEENCHEHAQNENDHKFSKYFCDNNTATSFEKDESRNVVNDNMHSKKNEGRPSLKDTHNVVSLDQYEQRRKLQRQDRTLTQTNSFESDAF